MSPLLKSDKRGKASAACGNANLPGAGSSAGLLGLWERTAATAISVVILLAFTAEATLAVPVGPVDPARAGARLAGGPGGAFATSQTVSWSGFTPTDWVTSRPQTSSITATSPAGLIPGTDVYSISMDGGTWSAWTADGLTVDIPFSTTHKISVNNLVLPDSASLNYIRYRVTETGGAESISAFYLIRVDATPPAAPEGLVASPAAWTNAASFTVSWTNPADVAGIAGAWYKLDTAPTSPTDGTYVATQGNIPELIPGERGAGDGAHAVYVWLRDTLGRADPKTAAMTTLYWDTTAPDPPTWMSGSPARQWTNVNRFSESWRNPFDLSGIVGAYYKLNSPPESATDGTFVKTVNTITDISVPRDGRNDIWVWLVDAAGNVDPTAVQSHAEVFWYDGTPPASSAVMTPNLPATGWYTSSISMSFSATDLPLDATRPPVVEYQLDSAAWVVAPPVLTVSTEGSHTLQYRARDKASNIEQTKIFNFALDETPPTAALQADRWPNNTGWYTAPVTYALSVADAMSGSPRGFYRLNGGLWQAGPVGAPAIFTLATEGSYRIEYYGQDAAGNRSKVSSLEAYVDATPPVTTHSVDGIKGENGWHVSNVTVRLLAQDNGSGVASTRYQVNGGAWQTGTQFQLSGDGLYNVAYYSTDAAGNEAPRITTQVKLDTAAPAAPANLSVAPAGWSRTNSFTVQWTSPHDFSGVTGAYYKLGDLSGGRTPAGPADGVAVPQTQRIEGLAVPTEGAYRLYLWLRDAAGNADQNTAPGMVPPANSPILRYDATAPITSVQMQGQPGLAGWWRSPVTVTLTSADGTSGIAGLHYRLDAGTWQFTDKNTAVLSITQPEKHVIEYYAEDVAGNLEPTQQYTVRLDFTAPPAPVVVNVTPEGWTRFNSFRLQWSAINELSGIAGAYVKFDAAPTSATDGVFYAGSTEINGVRVPGEGRHSAYLWLRDGAGNADVRTAIAIKANAWYDATPPVTVITQTAASGLNGWYVEPVSFDMSAADTTSGVLSIHYQIDNGAVQSATSAGLGPDTPDAASSFVVSADGQHTVRIWAEDRAGNLEPAHVFAVAIDQASPKTRFTGPVAPVTRTQFDVSWAGQDPGDGSGLASYDVQVRDGYEGPWQDWLRNTQLTSAQYTGQRAHSYFFRVYGQDRAGNRQTAPGMWNVLVQPVLNGGFDTGNFTDWTASGLLYSAVVATTGPVNVSTLSAKLGSELYGPSLTPPGNVPAGCATISQAIKVPDLHQMRHPTLRFWYRVLTYDVMYSINRRAFVDTLDAKFALEQGEPALLFRTGNPTNVWGELYDTEWRLANLNLTAFAGQSGVLSFSNCNGPQNGQPDNLFNTWSYVDSIEIYDRSAMYLPLTILGRTGTASGLDGSVEAPNASVADPGAETDSAVGQPPESTGTGEPLR